VRNDNIGALVEAAGIVGAAFVALSPCEFQLLLGRQASYAQWEWLAAAKATLRSRCTVLDVRHRLMGLPGPASGTPAIRRAVRAVVAGLGSNSSSSSSSAGGDGDTRHQRCAWSSVQITSHVGVKEDRRNEKMSLVDEHFLKAWLERTSVNGIAFSPATGKRLAATQFVPLYKLYR